MEKYHGADKVAKNTAMRIAEEHELTVHYGTKHDTRRNIMRVLLIVTKADSDFYAEFTYTDSFDAGKAWASFENHGYIVDGSFIN